MKVNRITDGVFTQIMGSDRERTLYDQFMGLENKIKSDRKTRGYLQDYSRLLGKLKVDLQQLKHTEELIILYRIKNNPVINLSTLREYIYARLVCPRDETRNQDIRVCVANSEFYPGKIEDLEKNEELMTKAKEKVFSQFDGILLEKEYQYNKLYNKK